MTKTKSKKNMIKRNKMDEKQEKEQLTMKKNKKIFIITFVICISILAIFLVKKTLQNDTFYTIKIGKLILENGIDMKDHFSFHSNLPYTYPHWLYDVFIYLIYLIGGYTGIYISSIVLFLILIYFLFFALYKITNHLSISAFSTFIATLSLSGFVTARAQLVSFILFALEVYFIEMFLKNGKKKYLLFLLLISLAICNIHLAVWPFYFIIFLPYFAEYILSLIVNKKKDNKFTLFLKKRFDLDVNSNIKYLFLIMLLSIFTGLITPLKGTPYTYMIKTMMGNSQKYIAEHQMITWSSSPFVIIMIFEVYFLSLFTRVKIRDLFMITGLTIMAVTSIRHISLLALVGIFCFARVFTLYFINNNLIIDNTIINFMSRKKSVICTVLVTIMMAGGIYFIQGIKNPDYIDTKTYPVLATEYIKDNLDYKNIRLFNEYNFGSYLLLNDIPVFIDSRADLYTKEFSGLDYDIFDDYKSITKDYQKVLKFYDISHLLIYKQYPGEKELSTFYIILKDNSNYNLLYEDDNFALFEKINDEDIIITYNQKK